MKYSVVVPVYLREESHRQTVINTLESIKTFSPNAEIIIVDDGSTIPTGFLREYADIYVRQPNAGISRAWNVGMYLAKNDYVAIVNDDIRVIDGWLDALRLPFEEIGDCGVTCPRFGGPTCHPRLLEMPVIKDHKFFSGYCFMLNKNAFYEDFDVNFKSNCGDTDYWHRIRKYGLNCYRSPLEIYHEEGGVLHGMDYQKLTAESLLKFENKWKFNPLKEYYSWEQ